MGDSGSPLDRQIAGISRRACDSAHWVPILFGETKRTLSYDLERHGAALVLTPEPVRGLRLKGANPLSAWEQLEEH